MCLDPSEEQTVQRSDANAHEKTIDTCLTPSLKHAGGIGKHGQFVSCARHPQSQHTHRHDTTPY